MIHFFPICSVWCLKICSCPIWSVWDLFMPYLEHFFQFWNVGFWCGACKIELNTCQCHIVPIKVLRFRGYNAWGPLFSFSNFWMISTFVIFNWDLELLMQFYLAVVKILNVDMKHIDNEHFLYLFVKCQKVFSAVILLLLQSICLVKFLLKISCVFSQIYLWFLFILL